MSFLSLIIKNLLRQRFRTILTVLGISIGITTIVALGTIAGGLRSTAGKMINLGGANFMVAQDGASDLSFSTVSETDAAGIAALPGVERADGVVMHITQTEHNPFFILLGARAADMRPGFPALREGRLLAATATHEIILGDKAAEALGAQIGATVTIDRTEFTVVGIAHSGNAWEDGGGYAPLATVQEIATRPGVVTAVFVTVRPDADVTALTAAIAERFPNLTTIADVSEFDKVDQGVRLIDAAYLAISFLAVGIGAIGVMNTMVMSVFERTRQIGIMRAVGWSGRRIIQMVLTESLVLCLFAVVVGCGLGVLASRAVLLNDTVGALLELRYTADVFIQALVVGVAVALAGAIYPAIRAIRLSPMEALRYE